MSLLCGGRLRRARKIEAVRRSMLLERGKPAMAGLVEPDVQAPMLRKGAQIEVAIVIDVNRDDRNDPA